MLCTCVHDHRLSVSKETVEMVDNLCTELSCMALRYDKEHTVRARCARIYSPLAVVVYSKDTLVVTDLG